MSQTVTVFEINNKFKIYEVTEISDCDLDFNFKDLEVSFYH
jgi:hypothetical protein